MMTDITIVVFRPRWPDLAASLQALSHAQGEFRCLRILLSGNAEQKQRLVELIKATTLTSVDMIHRYDNLGFAAGHNLLSHNAFIDGADSVLIFNPDLIVTAGAIEQFQRSVETGPTIAMYGPTLHYADNLNVKRIDSAGIYWTGSARHLDCQQGDLWATLPTDELRDVAGLTGACLLVPRAAYSRIVDASGDLFDPAFVAFREDAELGIRARRLGVRSISVLSDGFEHNRGNPGTGRNNELVNLLGVQNRFLILFKLGRFRPGSPFLGLLRDCVVIGATLTIERSSLAGLKLAFRIRRYERYLGARTVESVATADRSA